MLLYPVELAGSSDVVVTNPEGTGAPTMIVPGTFPDGCIVLVYAVAPADSDDLVTTNPEGAGEPATIVPGALPDG